jgi:hypothetical protein
MNKRIISTDFDHLMTEQDHSVDIDPLITENDHFQ